MPHEYVSIPGGDTGSMYHILHTKYVDPPVTHCHSVKGTPCPVGKTSYWRNFAVDLKEGGCGEPKKICGTTQWPEIGPPRYVVEPASRDELLKFL